MRFSLVITMNNAAFENEAEIPIILRDLADVIEAYEDNEGKIRDSNGNSVGSWDIR